MFLFPTSRQAHDLTRSLERLFDDSFGNAFGSDARDVAQALRSPALDVTETDQAYTVKLDMPGVPKEAVKITVEGRRIGIEAEQAKAEEKKDGERVLYRERSVARFSRTFSLPQEINEAESGARMEHGVLTLTLAKRVAKGGARLTVN